MRMNLIDGIRGHLLLGMMIAHLAFSSNDGDAARFILNFHHWKVLGMYDAEFFVPIAGFLMGFLLHEKWRDNTAKFTDFLQSRMIKVYKYQLLCAIPIMFFIAFDQPLAEYAKEFASTLGKVFILQAGFSYSDILPIYLGCFVVLIAGIWIGLYRNRLWLLVYFAAIYVIGQAVVFNQLKFIAFDVLSWSFLFNVFFLIGTYRQELTEKFVGLNLTLRSLALVITIGCWAVIRIFEPFPEFMTQLPERTINNWYRMLLNPIYMIWILSVIGTFVLIMTYRGAMPVIAWPRKALSFYLNLGFLRHVGSQPLQLFIAHVFIVNGYIYSMKYFGKGFEILGAAICLTLFFLFAYRKEIWESIRPRTKPAASVE